MQKQKGGVKNPAGSKQLRKWYKKATGYKSKDAPYEAALAWHNQRR